ncbi:LacI family DNA-binding transcriptional regulator [Paenibacillus xylaniclasticus]|uniref:LacI family DNA-binding transcriptional regulator n=1 Tax=Paenibacillus xylaniclasticus TaxID=588083 RepID=UPI000FDA4B6A|nr:MULTISPECIES: LacI family DNA-binding transcriptional regulator [Paenibacillus]GFN30788.1 LacI family transcriptional regulator [Paenibacillus curdlanolyticus]
MASLKEIAQAAGVSIGTVSVVLNGKADELRIAQQTRERIWAAAKQLDYHPNVTARRLRKGAEQNRPTIAVFWANDFPSELLGRFFSGIQHSILNNGIQCEVIVQPYRPSELHLAERLRSDELCNGAILTGVSDEDIRYLEATVLKVPVVVFNRRMKNYSSVYVDDYEAGYKAAELFASSGRLRPGIIAPNVSSSSILARSRGFLEGCQSLGLNVKPHHEQYAVLNMSGGLEAAKYLLEGEWPDSLFFPNGIMAVGAMSTFRRTGVRIPDDVAIITYGNSEHEQYTVPSLTSMTLPVEEMACACLELLLDMLKGKDVLTSRLYETPVVFRESFPEI